jgi:LysM repeat protein
MEIKKCLLTKNDCYKKAQKITPKGIVVHSTGANNPNLKRYVQPDDGILGKNAYNNHWNKSGKNVCVHAFIGKDKNGVVRCYQTLPFNYACWGVGSGKKGSYNYNPAYIQFEICEDNLKNKEYFEKAFKVAIDFCIYLAKEYNIKVENIVSHHEAHLQGYGSNHADCDHWLKKFGKNMDWFRSEVEKGLKPATKPATTTKPKKKSVNEIAKEVIAGKWGNGEERKKKLKAAGYDYAEVQKEVNKLLEKESTPKQKTYTVKKGDSLSKIGKKYNVKWTKIAKDNNIKFPYIIRVGQKLVIK